MDEGFPEEEKLDLSLKNSERLGRRELDYLVSRAQWESSHSTNLYKENV